MVWKLREVLSCSFKLVNVQKLLCTNVFFQKTNLRDSPRDPGSSPWGPLWVSEVRSPSLAIRAPGLRWVPVVWSTPRYISWCIYPMVWYTLCYIFDQTCFLLYPIVSPSTGGRARLRMRPRLLSFISQIVHAQPARQPGKRPMALVIGAAGAVGKPLRKGNTL